MVKLKTLRDARFGCMRRNSIWIMEAGHSGMPFSSSRQPLVCLFQAWLAGLCEYISDTGDISGTAVMDGRFFNIAGPGLILDPDELYISEGQASDPMVVK